MRALGTRVIATNAFARLPSSVRSNDAWTIVALAVVVAAAVGAPLASAVATGAMRIPHNDDWSYSRIAIHFAEHGEIKLLGWNQPSLIGHILLAQPFLAGLGHTLDALHVAQAVAAAAGLVFAYLVLRRFLTPSTALLATGLLAAFPGYALLATTYMTDTTAFAAQMACLYLGVRSLDGGRAQDVLLGVSLAVGFLGFTVREIALAAPLAVGAGWLLVKEGRRERVLALGLVVLVVALAAAFFLWRHSLPGDEKPWLTGDAPYYDRVEQLVRAFFTSAFAMLPLVVVVFVRSGRSLFTRWTIPVAALALVLGASAIAHGGGSPLTLFSGNSLTRVGAVDVALPGRPILFSRAVWGLMTLGALVSGVVLATLLARRTQDYVAASRAGRAMGMVDLAPKRGAAAALATYAALTVAVLALRAAAGTSDVYDRYLWGIGLILAVVVGRGLVLSGHMVALAALGALAMAAISAAIVLEEHASSSARWKAGQAAVSRGASPTSIDAGFEWMGWHYRHVVGDYSGPPRWRRPATWYNVLEFPASSNCTLMSYAPMSEPWLRHVETRRYHAFLLFGARTLYVYRNPPACR